MDRSYQYHENTWTDCTNRWTGLISAININEQYLAENLATVCADFEDEDAAVSRARVEVQPPPCPANHLPIQPTTALFN